MHPSSVCVAQWVAWVADQAPMTEETDSGLVAEVAWEEVAAAWEEWVAMAEAADEETSKVWYFLVMFLLEELSLCDILVLVSIFFSDN